ncbi:hypothetical protein GCM10027294_40760 [Marinactinospora endophytica]
MYQLHPDDALAAAREEFPAYLICEFHDGRGAPDYTAILREGYRSGMQAQMLHAPSLDDLLAELRAQPRPQPARHDRAGHLGPSGGD